MKKLNRGEVYQLKDGRFFQFGAVSQSRNYPEKMAYGGLSANEDTDRVLKALVVGRPWPEDVTGVHWTWGRMVTLADVQAAKPTGIVMTVLPRAVTINRLEEGHVYRLKDGRFYLYYGKWDNVMAFGAFADKKTQNILSKAFESGGNGDPPDAAVRFENTNHISLDEVRQAEVTGWHLNEAT